MRRSGVALRLVTICLPLLPTQHLSAEDGLLPPGPPVSWHAWAEKTKSALRQPTAQELAAAVGEVADALQAIENALDEISDGAILRRQWGLASLHNALRSQVPSLAALGTAEAQLAGRVPRSLQPVVNELHHRVAALQRARDPGRQPGRLGALSSRRGANCRLPSSGAAISPAVPWFAGGCPRRLRALGPCRCHAGTTGAGSERGLAPESHRARLGGVRCPGQPSPFHGPGQFCATPERRGTARRGQCGNAGGGRRRAQ